MRFISFFIIFFSFSRSSFGSAAFRVLIIKWNNRQNTIIDVLSDAFRAIPLHVYYFTLSLARSFFFGRFTIKTWTSSLSYFYFLCFFFYYFTIFQQNQKKKVKNKSSVFSPCFFITISYLLFTCLFFYCYHFIVMNIEIV